jgi:DNA-directed RNA polymerase specialized sigma24 family protein
MTAAGLTRLLERLHPDMDEAAAEYEHLRRALVRFFDWRGAWLADECADEALDRLARRLDEETTVTDLRSYAYGIARLVLLEHRRRPRHASIDDAPEVGALTASSPVEHPRQACFDRCLGQIDAEDRSVLLRYYEGERRAKISNRRRLATTLGLSETALRSRVQRLRDRLERCIENCASLVEREAL